MAERKRHANLRPGLKLEKGQKTLLDLFGKKTDGESSNTGLLSQTAVVLEEKSQVSTLPPSVAKPNILPNALDGAESLGVTDSKPKKRGRDIIKTVGHGLGNPSMCKEDVMGLTDGKFPPNLSTTDSSRPSTAFQKYNTAKSFDASHRATPQAVRRESLIGETEQNPIIISSSPVKLDPTQEPLHLILPSATTNRIKAFCPRESRRGKGHKPVPCPLPDQESQHVRGQQTLFSAPPLPLPRRSCGKLPTVDHQSPEPRFRIPALDQADIHTTSPPHATLLDSTLTSDIPIEHQHEHPAIAKLFALAASGISDDPTSAHKLWTDKWRPTRADEVLGNEHHARYLRDWLYALEVQFNTTTVTAPMSNATQHAVKKGSAHVAAEAGASKRPRVVRGIQRPRGRKKRRINSDDDSDGDAWIVGSDESEEETRSLVESDGEDKLCLPALSNQQGEKSGVGHLDVTTESATSSPHLRHNFGDQVANTILLTGPPGCGKTAAVYACANELGFEVFEVNPGTGKRNGANLDNLVGEVGKNHLVRKTKSYSGIPPHVRGTRREALKQGSTISPEGAVQDKLDEMHLDNDKSARKSRTAHMSFLAPVEGGIYHDSSSLPSMKACQSLVLLEEVDIIFREDLNFWPSVIHLIEQCQRPVVLTCNDASLIPIHDLALQSIIKFDPCPKDVAASYLQGMCLAERRFLKRESLVHLYETTCLVPSVDLPEVPLHPHVEDPSQPDLRRAINQLQLPSIEGLARLEAPQSPRGMEDLADWGPPDSLDAGTPIEQLKQLKFILSHAEVISSVDALILRSPAHSPEGIALCSQAPSLDDEVGHKLLLDPSWECDRPEKLEFNDRDESISRSLLQRSRRRLVASVGAVPLMKATSALQARALFRSRVAYQSRLVRALGIIPLSAPLLPRPAIFLDYLPWIRHMIYTEDAEELHEAKREKSGRQTRNSRRRERMIAIAEEHRVDIALTAFTGETR